MHQVFIEMHQCRERKLTPVAENTLTYFVNMNNGIDVLKKDNFTKVILQKHKKILE